MLSNYHCWFKYKMCSLSLSLTHTHTERGAVGRLHHVQGLRPSSAERPEEVGGRAAEDERGAEWRQTQGEENRPATRPPTHLSSRR